MTRIGRAGAVLLATVAVVALLGGCLAEKKKPKEAGGGGALTWTALTSGSGALVTCARAGCHTGASPTGNLKLDADQYDTIVTNGKMDLAGDLRIVDPGNKASSQLYVKASTGSMATYAGAGAADIGAWIDAGAPE